MGTQTQSRSTAPASSPSALLAEIRETCTRRGHEPIDLSGADLSGQDLSRLNLDGADLSGATMTKAVLRETKLSGANLRNAELSGADLTGAVLDDVDATNAGLGHAILRDASMFSAKLEGATLTMSDLTGADLRCARLGEARLREANLSAVDLTGADLRGVDLSLCNVSRGAFDEADLRHTTLRGVCGFESARWIGADIRDVNFAGAYRLRRFVVDQNYIKEYRESSRLSAIAYYVWWVTSDCGRSLARWCGWIAIAMLFYAWLFARVAVDHGDHGANALTAIYFSVVTLTTLGYGDILPASGPAQIVVILEVVTGYVMLGGLLSIFANKLARRGE